MRTSVLSSTLPLMLAVMLLLALPAWAAFEGPGSTIDITTVAQAQKASDDTPCAIDGYIVEKIPNKHDKYLFRDATGQLTVEIKDKMFEGRTITPNTHVRITGKVDKDLLEDATIDVKKLDIL